MGRDYLHLYHPTPSDFLTLMQTLSTEPSLLLERTWVSFPEPTQWPSQLLTRVLAGGGEVGWDGSDAFFGLHEHCRHMVHMHAYRQDTQKHNKINKIKTKVSRPFP